jgi:tripartite-type tricarboxylate transporter receptor subunit TctC
LPPAIAEKLNAAVRRTLKEPANQKYFEQQALLSMDLDLAATNAFVGHEVAHWGALAKSVGLALQ